MQHFRKIRKMNEEKDRKMYALTLMGKKSQESGLEVDNHTILENSTNRQAFILKNLDQNKVQIINKEEQLDKILKNVESIDIQAKYRDNVWWDYLTKKEKQEEIFLQACYRGLKSHILQIIKGNTKHPIQPSLAVTNQGKNALHLTIMNLTNDISIIQLLVENKVEINCQTQYDQRTPLMIATILGNQPGAQKLIELGASLSLQDNEGNTALHHAYIYDQVKIQSLLKNNNAPQNIKNNENKNPQQCIVKKAFKNSHQIKIQKKQNNEDSSQTKIDFDSANQKEFKTTKQNQLNFLTKVTLYDFKKLCLLGKGAFGKVYLVQNIHNQKKYALKSLDKAYIIKQDIIRYAMTQRKVLMTINHPFITKLHYAFQDSQELYLLMDYCPGGDMLKLLKTKGPLDQVNLRKYVCEIVLALEQLHRYEIIYRDLKPGNVVLDEEGHARLTDFGLSKEGQIAHSFCGSVAYLAPEMIWRKGHTKVMDWYLLGVFMYECLTGMPPFWDSNKQVMMQNIRTGRFKPLSNQFSAQLHNLISRLLNLNSNKRLGAKGSQQIKTHPWFLHINWPHILSRKQIMPPIDQISGKPIQQSNFQKETFIDNFIEGWEYSQEFPL